MKSKKFSMSFLMRQILGVAECTRVIREATINTLQKLEVDQKDSISKLHGSKDEILKFNESITAGKNKVKDMEVQIEDVKARIRQVEEKAHKIQQEKSLLEDTWLKCQEKRAEIVTMQTLEKIAYVEKKKR